MTRGRPNRDGPFFVFAHLPEMRTSMPRIRSFLLSAIVFLGLASLADHLLPPHFMTAPSGQGLVFPPHATFPYQTPEFSHEAAINSLGFRGREWDPGDTTAVRILAIGDSFTFGMGVDQDASWPMVLESQLRATGHDVAIANLGMPGAAPSDYVRIARKAIPALKPDIILIGVLQGDDLAQTVRQIRREQAEGTVPFPSRVAQYLYPNAFRIIRERLAGKPGFKTRNRTLSEIWQEQAKGLADTYAGEEKVRFDNMGAAAKAMFLQGQLNPALVNMAIADPQYFAAPLRKNDSDVDNGWERIRIHLQKIKELAGDSRVLVLSIPLGTYVSEKILQGRQEMGFTVFPEMLRTDLPDQTLQHICNGMNIPFFNVTAGFRKTSLTGELYYPYDGHFNKQGHRLFVDLLYPSLEKHIYIRKNK